jgi:ribose 5-phosphate isomerase B
VSDHAAVEAKAAIASHLRARGHEVVDLGTNGPASVDYPDFAAAGARAVARGEADRGVFLCGTGIGICISANKVAGVRAAVLHDETSAEMSRRHNDANVACFGGRTQSPDRMAALVDLWLSTPFDAGRHAGRVEKIAQIERSAGGIASPK